MTVVEPIRNKKDIQKIEKILSTNARNLLFFTMGINWGLRISDIIALNVSDVRGKTHLFITEKKTGKTKKLFINAKLKPMIENYTKGKLANKPLFESIYGNRLDRFAAYNIIVRACQRAGLEEHVGTHTLRKTFGYHHYQTFKDIALLQKIFNHSSPQITLSYIGIEQDQIDESYSNFIL